MAERNFYVGNVYAEGLKTREWIIGHFKSEDSPLHSKDIEIKHARHPSGDFRSKWSAAIRAHTYTELISGRFAIEFEQRSVELVNEGDFVVFGPGVFHRWRAIENSVMKTVRWPSVANDSIEAASLDDYYAGRLSAEGKFFGISV